MKILLNNFSIFVAIGFPEHFSVICNMLTKTESRSLINIRNKTGPRTDPCGTLLLTVLQQDLQSLMQTLCFLPLSHSFTHAQTFPSDSMALKIAVVFGCFRYLVIPQYVHLALLIYLPFLLNIERVCKQKVACCL